jgi:hypothetical protein
VKRAPKVLFPLGNIVATPGAIDAINPLVMGLCLMRHAQGDWGDLSEEDVAANNVAVRNGGRLLSAYGDGRARFWIITEWDRSVTTVLLPEEY